QEKGRTDERDQRAREEHDKIDNVKRYAGVVHVHQSKRAAKMGERKKFGNVANRCWQLFEWRKCAGENKQRQQKENGKLDCLRLGARERRDEQPEAERTKEEEQADQGKGVGLIKRHTKMPPTKRHNHHH